MMKGFETMLALVLEDWEKGESIRYQMSVFSCRMHRPHLQISLFKKKEINYVTSL